MVTLKKSVCSLLGGSGCGERIVLVYHTVRDDTVGWGLIVTMRADDGYLFDYCLRVHARVFSL